MNFFGMAVGAALLQVPSGLELPRLARAQAPATATAKIFSQQMGVSNEDLTRVFKAIKEAQVPLAKECQAWRANSRGKTFRQALVDCLIQRKTDPENFFRQLLQTEVELLKTNGSAEEEKTIVFVSYLKDLIRQNLSLKKNTAWFDLKKGFLEIDSERRFDFDFEDGDIILGFASAGISGMIGHLPHPTPYFSHVMMVRKRGSHTRIIESLPYTGMREVEVDELYAERYFQLLVLRWKNAEERKDVATKASDLADLWAQEQRPYDISMDIHDAEKFYCTEMVGRAYAEAALQPLDLAFGVDGKFLRESEKLFTSDIGFTSPQFMTSRSLLTSSLFQVVAEYRHTGNLRRNWQIRFLTERTLQMYEKGFKLRAQFPYTHLHWAFQVPGLVHIQPFKMTSALMKELGREGLSHLVTYEKRVISQSIESFDSHPRFSSLLNLDLVEFENQMEEIFSQTQAENFELRWDSARSVQAGP